MTEEIKPCPFCGHDVTHFEYSGDTRLFYIHCCNCFSRARNSLSYKGAVNYWNMRDYDFDMPAIVKKVQQLEKENEQLKKMLALGVNYERANG